jgi:hypothetical protein
VLFDFVVLGFIVPIGLGVVAFRVARSGRAPWVRALSWAAAVGFGVIVLFDIYQAVTL